jgi:predicted RNA-binding Zn-ribbon protein involved in translation (DUF1610 family)
MILSCPRCGGRLITRSTARRSEKSKTYPSGKPLGEIRRYRYCENCGKSVRTTHPLNEKGEEI